MAVVARATRPPMPPRQSWYRAAASRTAGTMEEGGSAVVLAAEPATVAEGTGAALAVTPAVTAGAGAEAGAEEGPAAATAAAEAERAPFQVCERARWSDLVSSWGSIRGAGRSGTGRCQNAVGLGCTCCKRTAVVVPRDERRAVGMLDADTAAPVRMLDAGPGAVAGRYFGVVVDEVGRARHAVCARDRVLRGDFQMRVRCIHPVHTEAWREQSPRRWRRGGPGLNQLCVPRRRNMPELRILGLSAATQDHFNALLCMASSLSVSDPAVALVVFSLDRKVAERAELLRGVNERLTVKEVNWTALPPFARVRPDLRQKQDESAKAGHYAWKPLLIAMTFEQMAEDALVWLDSEHRFARRGAIASLAARARELGGFFSPSSDGALKDWTHPRMISYLYSGAKVTSGGLERATLGSTRPPAHKLSKAKNCDAST
eukprot:63668-Prymnesium_polylepis.1